MAVLNFTGREDIDRSLIEIKVEKNVQPLKIYFKTQPALKANPKYAGCDVILEAYLRTRAERKELGKLEDLAPSVEIVFLDFLLPEGVQFRLKIVNPSDKKLTGVVDGLKEKENKEPKDDSRKRKTLLAVNFATSGDNLRHRFWKVDCNGSQPTLLIRQEKMPLIGDVNKPAFQALAFPAIMREVLTYAFIVRFDNPPGWSEDWATLAFILDGTVRPELAAGEKNRQVIEQYLSDTSDWIDGVCEKFAADCKLDRIDSTFKRGGV